MSGLLATTERALVEQLARVQSRGRFPSVVAGVVRDGALAWSGARGRTVRLGDGARADADTQYKIGSVTKTMTAALVLLARERGEVALDDRVGRFLPKGPFADATLRGLLSHAAGLTAEPHGEWWERTTGGDLDALVAAHEGAEPVLEPGAQLHYSNLGYGVLGGVVEQVTGQPWVEACAEQLWAPLGLARTSYHQQAPHAEGFAVDALTGELTLEPLPDTGAMAPAGQLWSTVADLGTWLTALVDADRSVLSAASLRAMRTPQVASPEDRDGAAWGLGVSVLTTGGRVLVGHGGSMPGFSCGVVADADSGTGAVLLTNGAYGLGPAVHQLLATVLEREPALEPEWSPVTHVPADVRDVVGTWHWGHAPSVVRWDGRELLLDPATGPGRSMRFAPGGETDTWVGTRGYLTGETLRAVRRDDGTVSHLEAATFVWTRTPYDPAAPIPGECRGPDAAGPTGDRSGDRRPRGGEAVVERRPAGQRHGAAAPGEARRAGVEPPVDAVGDHVLPGVVQLLVHREVPAGEASRAADHGPRALHRNGRPHPAAVPEAPAGVPQAADPVVGIDDDLDRVAVEVVVVDRREDVGAAPAAGALDDDAALVLDGRPGGLGGLGGLDGPGGRGGQDGQQEACGRGGDGGEGAGREGGGAGHGGASRWRRWAPGGAGPGWPAGEMDAAPREAVAWWA